MNQISNPVIKLVINQIKDALSYIPDGYLLASRIIFVVIVFGLILKFGLHKNITIIFWQKVLVAFFFIIYVYCVLQLTILSRFVGNFGGIDWRIFAKWSQSDSEKAFLIANIIMFIPYGILLPFTCKWTKHILVSLPIATLSSIGIEAIQLKYQIGFCQLDDVIVNSVGFLIGFLIYLMIADIYLFVYTVYKAVIACAQKVWYNEKDSQS